MEGIYELIITDDARQIDLTKLEDTVRKQIIKNIQEKLSVAPEHFGKPLRHGLKNTRALRVGNYRILFSIQGKVVKILAIFHRSIGYEDLLSRMEP